MRNENNENNEATEEKKEEKPTTVYFVRHGENDWTESHKLAGRAAGVHLNGYGRQQAEALAERLAEVKFSAIYASPLERTVETAQAIAARQSVELETRPNLLEVDYGQWTGEEIKKLSKEASWPVIQYYPSGASFPDGETMYGMQARFVQAVNRLVAHHPGEIIAIVGHADLIKSAIAHYLGVHLDLFQRIVVSTASISAISFTKMRPMVLFVNDTHHNPPKPEKEESKEGDES